MALYLVGDIQGCYVELCNLIEKINFDKEQDEIWFTGDLVARGPDSLSTLRLIKSMGDSVKTVLGNHDLHLLAVYAGLKRVKKNDHITELLAADDVDELIDWLASQPLLLKIPNEDAYVSHAGITSQWQIETAIEQAQFVQEKISSKQRNYWLEIMYGNTPTLWDDAKSDEEKFRFSVNALTRMRFCGADGGLEFSHKLGVNSLEGESTPLHPWFVQNPTLDNINWIFGHWAALEGKCEHPNVYALDTGCVWGGELTMLRWDDKKRITVPSTLTPHFD